MGAAGTGGINAERASSRSGRRRPHRRRCPVYLVGVGTVRALNLVTVRTQVSGMLIRIAFREGQDVKKGDVLVEIDPNHLQGATRPADGQEGARRGDARQFQGRS